MPELLVMFALAAVVLLVSALASGLVERAPISFPMYLTAVWLLWVLAKQRGADAIGLVLAAAVVLGLGLWWWEKVRWSRWPARLLAGLVVLAALWPVVVVQRMPPPERAAAAEQGVVAYSADALYYQAFLFLTFALFFVVGWLPGWLSLPVRVALVAWLFAYFPIALRRVYGGSGMVTAVKAVPLVLLYLMAFAIFVFGFVTYMAIITF